MIIRLLKPGVSSFGYAVFLAVNAMSIWGGTFPLLPLEFQTFNLLVVFFLVESIAFCCMLLGVMACSWFFPSLVKKTLTIPATVSMFLGSASLLAPLYLSDATLPLVVIGAILLGAGSAITFALWQRVFASHRPERGNLDLMVGTAFSAIVYALLHTIPIAVAAFCVAFIAIPLVGLCLTLATRTVDFDQPMFEDPPRQHLRVYQNTLRFYVRSALCVGAFGFASGVARALALSDPSMGLVVNLASMVGALASSLILIILWYRYTFRFSAELAFRTIFPVITTLLLLLPFLGFAYLRIFAGLMYMFFAFALMVMVIQCAQVSRDHGINPVFIYGFFALLVYGLQSIGFLTGYLNTPSSGSDFTHLAILALLIVWFLGLALYFVRGRMRHEADDVPVRGASIEFIALSTNEQPKDKPEHAPAKLLEGKHRYRDRFALQCANAGKLYRLTARECEIMELIARGNSVAHIAERLVVSENTIRTHSKRVYVKLNVHKRQDLLDLLDEMG